MVSTRSKKEHESAKVKVTETVQPTTSGLQNVKRTAEKTSVLETDSIKSEIPLGTVNVPTHQPKCSSITKKSSSSSIQARKKRLELEAAEAKARIELELINKRLEADLADLDDDYSPPSEHDNRSDVAKWVERSQQELETQAATVLKEPSGFPRPPVNLDTGTDGPIHQLANVLKEFMTTTVNNNNVNLMSRMSTSRDLPVFAGNPMEWLQFKMAYEESTQVCQFSDAENLCRLRKCLRGPARDAVTALLITATSPAILMSTLELQFGNPDEILSRIILEIRKLNSVSPEYHKDIVVFSNKIKNYVAAVRALGREGFLQDTSLVTIVLSKLPTILLSKWSDYRYLHNNSATTRLDVLSEFLHEEAIKVSQCSVTLLNNPKESYIKRKYIDNSANQSYSVLLQSENSIIKCRYCNVSTHKLVDCKKFKKSLRKDRWKYVKRFNLCYKCLSRHNNWQNCPAPVCDVNNCGQAHHRLLHFVRIQNNINHSDSKQNSAVHATADVQPISTEVVAHVSNHSISKVLLKVVPINIHGPTGVISTYALLDDGSTVSLISSDLARRAGLRSRREHIRVCGAWNNTELICDSYLADITLSNQNKQMFTLSARCVTELNLPKQNINIVNIDHFSHLINVKGDLCVGDLKPEILIGQDNYHLMLPLEVITGIPKNLYATRTPLGWCIHGRAPTAIKEHVQLLHSTLLVSDHESSYNVSENTRMLLELHEEVRQFFVLDSLGVASKPRQNYDDVRAQEQLDQTSCLVDGRWYVGLPWKNEKCSMPDSFPHALSRLKAVERKMKRSEDYANRYKERVQHLFDNDYAHELKDNEVSQRTWYLPHFGVDNPNKKKLRLVFDAAAKSNGFCLNDYFLKGPDLLTSLFGIMLRFREHRVAITGDIKDMFLRIKIRQQDQDAFRFLYRHHPNGPIKTYAMTSLIFGANCSPFVAQYIKNKNAQRFEGSMKTACDAIYHQHYADDYIDSVPDENTATNLIRDVTMIHQQGGFEMRNWTCNNKHVLDTIPKEALGEAAVKFKLGEQHQSERTLGLIWFPDEDVLGFDVSFKRIPEVIINGTQRPTKRDMLKVVMSIFDVYGFLSPFTINGKILLQDCWQIKMNWDDPIPDELYKKWCKWLQCLKTVQTIRLPRYYCHASTAQPYVSHANTTGTIRHLQLDNTVTPPAPLAAAPSSVASCYTNLQLHVFCDSSSKAMCAVAYWRWEDNTIINKAFVASKSRVAPCKPVTIPRLELQAAVLAARLAHSILMEHKMPVTRRIFWCDSTTVLHWIRNNTRNYNVFVANRLGEIDELTNVNEWRYIPTKINIADIGTRETYDYSILQNEWLHGPDFLYNDEQQWPEDIVQPENKENNLECISVIQTIINNLPIPEPTRFSSWLRLLRTTHVVLMFIKKCRKLTNDTYHETMEQAENLLLRYSQGQTFCDEIDALQKGKQIHKSSKLLTLSPYLDEHGVLRLGGRIDNAADISPETKRPAIIDGRDYITKLIVKYYHTSAAHGNQETVVNNLKQKYWIIRIRPTVKNVVSACTLCRLRKCKPEVPRMGDLPAARLAHHQRPFTFCGVDLFGPMEVTIGRRRERRYGVLFTCLTVRAIHLELVSALTTDSFILALRRMAARRGWPQHIFSDNGTNLRGADTELKRAAQELDEEILQSEAKNHGTKWTFIPAASPHWAGAWERLIRSVKSSLRVILKERAPREETLATLLAEVENIVNSRPLTHVSVDPDSQETLTPNHFLLGSSTNLPHMGIFDDSEFHLRKQWRIAQRLADLYWKRWLREVLPDMLPRKKWNEEQRSLQVGDLVLIVDPDGPRNIWPRGIIERVLPGKDGRVRMVTVRTKTGVLTRSAARIARLPIGNECC